MIDKEIKNQTPTQQEAANEKKACPTALIKRLDAAKKRRSYWEPLWDDAYDYALPRRNGFQYSNSVIGQPRTDHIYDSTAMDGAEQLASSLLGHLTPSWTPWFGLKPGSDLSPKDAKALAPILERAERIMHSHFENSNFSMEIHQCYLDLVVGGTASLAFEENDPGHSSAFKFTATPLTNLYLEEGPTGFLDGTFRTLQLTAEQIQNRYPNAQLSNTTLAAFEKDEQKRYEILEAVIPNGLVYDFTACILNAGRTSELLVDGQIEYSPMINFRWIKTPDEIYGRSPIMKALPDIKTANKVVELILKNASLAVTGLWQTDDDGVMNPMNIELKPGSIIPKAPGSSGLEPIEMPSNFDTSQLVLESLQGRIRRALLIDQLGPIAGNKMSATEVLERSAEMALLMGATYGRLQSEMLTPIITRAFNILRRRGEIEDLALDGRMVAIEYRSPLSRAQGQSSVQNTISWLDSIAQLGAEGKDVINKSATARFLGEVMGVPSHLINQETKQEAKS